MGSAPNKVENGLKVSIQERAAECDETKAASLAPIGKQPGEELPADPNPRATGINLKIILIKRKNFVVFFLRNST